jgi:integrase
MSAKVIKKGGSWWIRTHHAGRKHERHFGPTKADKAKAEKVTATINAKIALGEYDPSRPKRKPIPFGDHLQSWHELYSPTFKPRYRQSAQSLLDNHLIPYFGKMDLREISREDLVRYINHKMSVKSARTKKPIAPSTIQNGLTIIRRVLRLAVQDGLIDRDPSAGIGAHLAKLARNQGIAAEERESFTRGEAEQLLNLASERLPEFEPFLRLLLSTGMRVGEAIGLEWRDVNFDRGVIEVRRSVSGGFETSPKSGKSRTVYLSIASTGCSQSAGRRSRPESAEH